MPAPKVNYLQRNRLLRLYDSGKQIITFDDFSGGEFGSEAPWRAPKTSFTGLNVVRYVDGSIGPRNGLKKLTLSGDSISGTIKGWGRQLAVGGNFMWIIAGTNVYVMSATGVVDTAGTVSVAPEEPPQSVPKGGVSYVSVIADKLYKIDHAAGTTAAIAAPNSPGLRCIAQYGERTMAGGRTSVGGSIGKAPDGTNAPGNRLYFSDASNPESWPAANFIDIGDDSIDITAITPQRTHCMIATSDGSWWLLTGVPGVNPVLRPALLSVSPAYPQHVAQIGTGNLGYVIASSTTNGSTASLGQFTGSQITLNEKITFGDGRRTTPFPTYTVIPLKNDEDWFVQGGTNVAPNGLALHQLGAWTLHQWQVAAKTLTGFCVSSAISADQHFFTDGTDFYQWRSYNNRPAFTGDTLMQPGDSSTTPFTANFTLPEWYSGDGREVGIVEIVVDFTSWNTGSGSTNHFDITPTTLRTYEAGSIAGSTLNFDEAGASSSTGIAGTRHRKRFSWGALPHGNGFQIAFAALRGVAIQKIEVHIETNGARF